MSLTSVFSVLGGTVALAVSSLSTNSYIGLNWRTAFWFGVVVALIGTVARTTLKETPEFANAQKRVTGVLNKNQKKELQNNPIWVQESKNDKKTLFLLFTLDCGWPVCFYFSYIFCGDILKREYGFSASEVLHQNFVVSMIQFIGTIILSFISYKIYPPKIVKVKLGIFIMIALISPFLMNVFHSSYIIFFIHLFEYCGYFGILVVLLPVVTVYIISINHFDRLEKEAGNYH